MQKLNQLAFHGSCQPRANISKLDTLYIFSPLPEEMIQFDEYFSSGLEMLEPPTRKAVRLDFSDVNQGCPADCTPLSRPDTYLQLGGVEKTRSFHARWALTSC